eukprot:COSAG02_NODE_1025_length_15146_cov_21.959460_4_plen_32_part_00
MRGMSDELGDLSTGDEEELRKYAWKVRHGTN